MKRLGMQKFCSLCRISSGVNQNQRMKHIIASLSAIAAIILSLFLSSCNVTRTITNESKYVQRGDTSVVITTKTIETYDASKKL